MHKVFIVVADELSDDQGVAACLADRLTAPFEERLFGRPDGPAGAGWIGDLYGRLCQYAHARPGYTLADVWQSNGPIFAGEAVQEVHKLFVETVCAACVIGNIGRPEMMFTVDLEQALRMTEVKPTKIVSYALLEVCGRTFA